jgi:hypothetical protein
MRTWNRPPIIALLFAVAMLAFAGCTQREAPLMAPGDTSAHLSEAVSPYTLAFISRGYDSESNQTTFLYQLQNTGASEGGPASGVLGVFTSVMVEVPICAPTLGSFSPPDGGTLYTNANGIHGVEWGVGYDENPSFYYSLTFPGDVPAGTVRGMVSRGGLNYIQNITGPCEGTFQIQGNVFTDADFDGFKGLTELGISDVTVTLTDGESSQTVKTDSDGNYLFIASTGTYTVRIDSLTADSDFNETLYQTWDRTTPVSRSVTVGPDSFANNFGWEASVDKIVAGIDNGTYPTTGKSYKWWRKELLRAINNQHNTAYTPAQLIDFIHQIDAMALLSEYHFTPGHELQEAYDILNNHAFGLDDDGTKVLVTLTKDADNGRHDAFAFLLRELLTTEFNQVSGRGLVDLHLQLMLINWGEGVLSSNGSSSSLVLPGDDNPNSVTPPVDAAGTIFRKANGATGGGGTGG